MHILKLALFLLALCFAVFSHGGGIAGEPLPDTFLWKVEKKGQPVSYLLGTVHMGKERPVLSGKNLNALDKTTTLMTETDLLMDNQSEALVIATMMFNSVSPLAGKIGEERFNRLTKELAPRFTAEVLIQMKPWAALALLMYTAPAGYSEEYGIDMLLTKSAKLKQKKIIPLESNIDALNVFARLPEDKVISMIDYYLNNYSELNDTTKELLTLYYADRLNELLKQVEDMDKMYDDFPAEERKFWKRWSEHYVLDKRTAEWMPAIEVQLEEESTLIAVGVAHLFGENGLIERLRKSGYDVSPL